MKHSHSCDIHSCIVSVLSPTPAKEGKVAFLKRSTGSVWLPSAPEGKSRPPKWSTFCKVYPFFCCRIKGMSNLQKKILGSSTNSSDDLDGSSVLHVKFHNLLEHFIMRI